MPFTRQPEPGDANSRPPSSDPTKSDSPPSAKNLLDQAFGLSETVPVDVLDYADFLPIAHRIGRQPFGLTPVVEELVGWALGSMFPRMTWQTPGGKTLIHELSATLYSDPQCANRLKQIWDRLQQDL